VAILGAQGLGMALATELRAGEVPVVVIDTDPQRCHEAESNGFAVVFGDGLQERTLRRARIELVDTAVGATFNDNLNSQFARYARHAFEVPAGLVSVGATEGGRAPEHVTRHHLDVLFDAGHDQERWDVRWRQGDVRILHFEFRADPGAPPANGDGAPVRRDDYVLLTIERAGRLMPMRLGLRPRAGDRSAAAINARAEAEAVAALAASGWRPVPAPAGAPLRT
jgi:hypothetical protein